MRHILNGIVNFVWFVMTNILFSIVGFAIIFILENGLFVPVNSAMVGTSLTDARKFVSALEFNEAVCNVLVSVAVAYAGIFLCLKVADLFCGYKINLSTIQSDKVVCDEMNACNSALMTRVKYLRI